MPTATKKVNRTRIEPKTNEISYEERLLEEEQIINACLSHANHVPAPDELTPIRLLLKKKRGVTTRKVIRRISLESNDGGKTHVRITSIAPGFFFTLSPEVNLIPPLSPEETFNVHIWFSKNMNQ